MRRRPPPFNAARRKVFVKGVLKTRILIFSLNVVCGSEGPEFPLPTNLFSLRNFPRSAGLEPELPAAHPDNAEPHPRRPRHKNVIKPYRNIAFP